MATKKAAPKKTKPKANSSWLQRHWIALAVIVVFAGIGTYIIGTSSAATKWYVSELGYQCPSLPTIQLYSQGDCVKAVQKGLNNRNENLKLQNGTAYTPLKVSGIYNPATVKAVTAYQAFWKNTGKKIAADGVMGPATWDRFLNDCLVFSDPAQVGWHTDEKGGGSYYVKPGYLCGT